MDETIEGLRARQDELVADSRAIIARADSEKREITDEEQATIDSNSSEFDRLGAQIERREKVNAQSEIMLSSAGRKTPPQPVGNERGRRDEGDDGEVVMAAPPPVVRRQQPIEPQPRARDHGQWGFRSLGEFAMTVRRHGRNPQADPRLDYGIRMAQSTYGNESVGEQGGILVPPDFRTELMVKITGEDSLISRTDQMTSASNTFVYPSDETTPWSTNGIQAYWESEGATKTATRPVFTPNSLRLNKIIVLVPVSDELLEDAPALDGYLRRKAPEKMDFKISHSIISGSGIGQPLGILNSAATITVAKETSQVADTLVGNNILKMWTRMFSGSRRNAIWLAHQDIEPQLYTMHQFVTNVAGTENVGGYPVFLPPGGYSQSPYATLMGRPIIFTEACETLGDLGDIILADLSQYLSVRKALGLRTDTSIHLYFDQDLTAYRFVMRLGGQPWWQAPIASRDGSNTRSPFVTLAARG